MAKPGGTDPVAVERALDEQQPQGDYVTQVLDEYRSQEDLVALRWSWFIVGWCSAGLVLSALLLVLL